jgi:hypothetical protein
MPNNVTTNNTSIDEFEEDDDDFAPDDFGFIIGPDGELKSVMYPEHLMEDPPEEIKMILQIFGIDSIDTLENRTLH